MNFRTFSFITFRRLTRELSRHCHRILIIASLTVFSLPNAMAGNGPELFSDLPNNANITAQQAQRNNRPEVIRSRHALVNIGNLHKKKVPPGQSAQPGSAGTAERNAFTLNLFPGVSYAVTSSHIELREAGKYTWFGSIDGLEHSQVILVINNGLLTGNVLVRPGEMYQIRPVSKSGVHGVYEIDVAALKQPE